MPDSCEQETIRKYCNERELPRPDTDAKRILLWFLCIELVVVVVSLIAHGLFTEFGISFFTEKYSWLFIYYSISVLLIILFLKKILITAVELYQHYAPEGVRRKCICMPTCSEYAILALEKYGVIKGLYKIYIRLDKTCKGNTYHIDYP